MPDLLEMAESLIEQAEGIPHCASLTAKTRDVLSSLERELRSMAPRCVPGAVIFGVAAASKFRGRALLAEVGTAVALASLAFSLSRSRSRVSRLMALTTELQECMTQSASP